MGSGGGSGSSSQWQQPVAAAGSGGGKQWSFTIPSHTTQCHTLPALGIDLRGGAVAAPRRLPLLPPDPLVSVMGVDESTAVMLDTATGVATFQGAAASRRQTHDIKQAACGRWAAF